MKDRPLEVEIDGEDLVIRIGIGTLAFAAENCQLLHEMPGDFGPPYCKIVDQQELAKDVCRALQEEEEDGTTPLHVLLDQCIVSSFEDGGLAFEEDFVAPKIGD